MDFLGPLPSGEELMVLVDEYSRFPIVKIIRSVSANTVIPVLDKHLATFRYPDVIKSDSGPRSTLMCLPHSLSTAVSATEE